ARRIYQKHAEFVVVVIRGQVHVARHKQKSFCWSVIGYSEGDRGQGRWKPVKAVGARTIPFCAVVSGQLKTGGARRLGKNGNRRTRIVRVAIGILRTDRRWLMRTVRWRRIRPLIHHK